MSADNPKFIVKARRSARESLCISRVRAQQGTSELKLILFQLEKDRVNLSNGFLFQRVSPTAGLYARFRDSIWYEVHRCSVERSGEVVVYEYAEYQSIWELMEKHINPVASTLAALIGALVSIIGINVWGMLQSNQKEVVIEDLRQRLHKLEIEVSSMKGAVR